MRLTMLPLAVVLGVALALSPGVSAQSVQPVAAAIARQVVGDVKALRTVRTLGEWKRTHAGEQVQLFAERVPEASLIDWAVRSERAGVIGDVPYRRTVFFLAPPVPVPFVLPADAQAVGPAVDEAVPGYMWFQIAAGDVTTSEAIAAQVRAAINAELGAGTPDAKIAAWGTGFWEHRVLWQTAAESVGMGTAPDRDAFNRLGKAAPRTSVVVVASLPASGQSLAFDRPEARGAENAHDSQYALSKEATDSRRRMVDEAIGIAAIGGKVEADVQRLASYVSPDPYFNNTGRGDADGRTLVEALAGWLRAAEPLDAARRAAALFVADQVLHGACAPFGVCDGRQRSLGGRVTNPSAEQFRARLAALGAQFVYSELGDCYVYTHSWLKAADKLRAGGRIAELIFLTFMEMGFETGLCGDQQGEGFRAVLERGSEFLRSTAVRDPALVTDVQFLMAQASSDIVALATGAGYEGPGGSEQQKWKASEGRARKDAITWYRLALQKEQNSARARLAWSELWRLRTGAGPSRTYFYCVYD